jgi:tetratricopeptide (TPR) repeat protein
MLRTVVFVSNHCRLDPSRLLFWCLLALVAVPTTVSAQGVGAGRDLGGSGGNHVITGRIYFPTPPAGDIRIKVKLESTSAPGLSTSTNADGVFRFSGLNTGYYTVIIDAGDQFEIFREQIDIERGNSYSPRTVQIPVHLRLKGSGPRSMALTGTETPKAARELYDKAALSAQKGDHKKAIEQLNAAIAIHRNYALALNELGVQHLILGQPDKAADALQSAVKIAPEEFQPHLNYGIVLLNQRKFDEAELHLRKAMDKNDGAFSAHLYLGIVLVNRKSYPEAETELLKAITLGGEKASQAHYYLGGLYWRAGDHPRAATHLEKYLELEPKAANADKIRATIKDLRNKS